MPAHGEDPGPDDSEDGLADGELVVRGAGKKSAATDQSLGRDAVEATPARSADELLRALPGLHLSAHGGHGKAYQYFLRGFDAVHGGDLAVDVVGVPVNEPSNVHAHGYLDLHFLPSVLVQQVELHPGSTSASRGDFAVAGAARFELGLAEAGGVMALGAGTDRSGHVTVAWRPEESRSGSFLVADAEAGEGVGMGRDWRQLRAGAGIDRLWGTTRARAWLLAYDGVFGSPGVLREDDLADGEVGFYDAYRGSGGGRSTRVLGSGQLTGGSEAHAWRLTAWTGWRQLALQQNSTGWYADPAHGDGTEQQHRALTAGTTALATWTPSPPVLITSATTLRTDHLVQGEDAVLPDGTPWKTTHHLQAIHTQLGTGASLHYTPRTWLAVEPGLRAELFAITVDGQPTAWAPVLAPKFRARVEPVPSVALFTSYGRGFRSPDARAVTPGERAPIATSDSVELGATTDPLPWLSLRTAGFTTLVSDELVFDHVTARYLLTGSTRRIGVDTGLSVAPMDALRFTTDLTWSDGRYLTTGTPIPYAPRLLVVSGLYAERLPLGSTLLTAGLRSAFLGPRPLPDGFVSTPSTVVDLTTTLRWQDWGVSLDVDNVLGSERRDGEFVYASQWDPSADRSDLPARHFTAGAPPAGRLSLSRRF